MRTANLDESEFWDVTAFPNRFMIRSAAVSIAAAKAIFASSGMMAEHT